MVQGNLQRVRVQEYIFRLSKNTYPLLSKEESKPETLLSKISFKTVHQASPIKFSLPQVITVLDWFNSKFHPCHYCSLPYSYQEFNDETVCIFCYIHMIKRPVQFYLHYSENQEINGLSIHPSGTSVTSNLFSRILTNDKPIEEIQEIIDKKLGSSKFVEKSLDEFF